MLHHKGTQTIDTERLTLRPFRYTDNDDMLTYWVSDPNPTFRFIYIINC